MLVGPVLGLDRTGRQNYLHLKSRNSNFFSPCRLARRLFHSTIAACLVGLLFCILRVQSLVVVTQPFAA